jgi:CTP:phosphocholine cytidylyltransferase-like protein
MNIIILGDKYQKGMKSKGCVGLIKYNNRSIILDNQYHTLKNIFPKSNIVYVYGFDGKRFINFIKKHDYDISLIYNENFDKFNSAYSLLVAKKFLDSETLIVSGNTLIKASLFSAFHEKDKSHIFVSKNEKVSNIGCVLTKNTVENISFDLSNTLYDMFFLSRTDSILVSNLLSQNKYNNYFIFEIFNKLIELGSKVNASVSNTKIKSQTVVKK